MFSYEILEDDGVVVLTTSGPTTIENYQDVAPKFYADVRSKGVRRILLDNREFQGWHSDEAPTVTFFSWIESRPLFDRIAVVFHERTRNEAEKFQEFFRNAGKDIRLFKPEQYEEALNWVKGE